MLSNVGIQALIAAYLGAGKERDALFVAMSVPLFLNTLMVASFGVVATPAVLAYDLAIRQRRVATQMLLWLTVVMLLIAGVLYVLRVPSVQLLAPGFDGEQKLRVVGLLRVTLIIVPLQSATCILSGYWIARERVLLPSLALVLGNAAMIVAVAWSGKSSTGTTVAWVFLVGAAITFGMQCIPYILEARKTDSGEGGSHLSGSTIYRQSLPLLASSLVGRSAPLIERNLASSMGQGTISCLGYAGYLVSFLVNTTTSPTATAYYAKMCRHWNEGRREELTLFLKNGSVFVVSSSLAVGGAVALSAHELLHAVMPYTKFTVANIAELTNYSVILMVAYVFLAFGSFVARIFYAANRFLQAAVLDCVAVGFYVTIALPLSRKFGGYGLIVAACANAMFLAILIVFAVKKLFSITFPLEFWSGLARIFVLWIVSFSLSYYVQREIGGHVGPLAATAWSMLVYIVGLLAVAACALLETKVDSPSSLGQ